MNPAGAKTVSSTPESLGSPHSAWHMGGFERHHLHMPTPYLSRLGNDPQAQRRTAPHTQASTTPSPHSFTNEVPPRLMSLLLPPVSGPANEHGVVLQPPEAPGLNQVGHAISQVGGDHYLAEALHLLCLHQAPDGLRGGEGSEKDQPQASLALPSPLQPP